MTVQAATCVVSPPMEGATGMDIGFIMIPGAQVSNGALEEHHEDKCSPDPRPSLRPPGQGDPETASRGQGLDWWGD